MTAYGTSVGYDKLNENQKQPIAQSRISLIGAGNDDIYSNNNANNNISNNQSNALNIEKAYSTTQNVSSHSQSVEDRLREIQEREQRAIDLQKELDEKEKTLHDSKKGFRPPKNWPTRSCAWARHDIRLDIPNEFQTSVKQFYFYFWLTCIAACWNWLVIMWWALAGGSSSFTTYLMAVLYVVVGLPCSWMFWYKRYYTAMQMHGDLSYMFFVFFALHILWCGIMAVGFETMSAAGILLALKVLVQDNMSLSVCLLVSTVLWISLVLGGCYLVKVAREKLGMFLAKKYAKMYEEKEKDEFN